MSDNEKREFSSYSALDREAMIGGVPLLPFIATIAFGVMATLAAQIKFGIVGFAFILFIVPIVLFLRLLVMNDDKAIRILAIETLFKSKRRGFSNFNDTLTFMPSRFLRNESSIEQIVGISFDNPKRDTKV